MKFGILSDIHGNDNALKAVLLEAERQEVTKLLILGDIFGYFYEVEKVIQRLKGWDTELVRGNHEIILDKMMKDPGYSKIIELKYGLGHSLAIELLSKNSIEYLINLKDRKTFNIDRKIIHLCHANPWDLDTYLYPDSSSELLERKLSFEADYIFFGHSHYQFFYLRNDGKVLVNVGSVGQNRKKGGIANWATFDSCTDELQLLETFYDILPLLKSIRKAEPQNKYLIKVLQRQ